MQTLTVDSTQLFSKLNITASTMVIYSVAHGSVSEVVDLDPEAQTGKLTRLLIKLSDNISEADFISHFNLGTTQLANVSDIS